MKLFEFLIVLLVITSSVFCHKLRHRAKQAQHPFGEGPNDHIDWSKETAGPHSPQIGVLEPPEGQLTDNWNELINDKSKRMITLGMPKDVDLNANIAIGSAYEDVEYVKNPPAPPQETAEEIIARIKQPVTVRMAKTGSGAAANSTANVQNEGLQETITPEEQALEDLVAVEFDRDVQDAGIAFNNLMRHQDQILAFLDSIEHVIKLSEHQQIVVTQLVKYIKLVTGAHEDLKREETEDDQAFLDEIAKRIHVYTFGVDSQAYNKAKLDSEQRNLGMPANPQHRKFFNRVQRALEHAETHLKTVLAKGETFVDEQLRQAEKLEAQAQKASKVFQTYYVIDEIRRLNVLKQGQEQFNLASQYKAYINSEVKTLQKMMSDLGDFEQEMQNNPEPEQKDIEAWMENRNWYINERQIVNMKLAIHSLDIEDDDTYEAMLELVHEHLRAKISLISSTLQVVQKQYEMCMTLEDQVTANDMHGAEDTIVALADDTFDNQKLVVINPQITQAGFSLKLNIRELHLLDAENLTKGIMAIVVRQNFETPFDGSLDFNNQSTEDLTAQIKADNVVGLDEIVKDVLVDVKAENFQGADLKIERAADRAQQVSKIMKVQAVIVVVENSQSVAETEVPGIEELKKITLLEQQNLEQDLSELQHTVSYIQELINTNTKESFNQSSKKVSEIIQDENIGAEAKWSLMYAKKYIDQNDPSISERHLNHALFFLGQDENALTRSIESVQRQNVLLDKALHLAHGEDIHVCTSYLNQVIDEINVMQPVAEIDEKIENKAQDAKEAMEEGDVDKTTRDIKEMVANVVDVYGGRRKFDTTFPRILDQTEARGDYIDGHQGEDIRDVNLSVDQVDHAKELRDVEDLVDLINENLEEIDLNQKDKGWLTQPHKLEAERQLERLYKVVQLDYKKIDIRITKDKLNNLVEAGAEPEKITEAIEELKESNEEERTKLERMQENLEKFSETLTEAFAKVGDDTASNQVAAKEVRALVENEYANVAIMNAVQDSVRFLDANKIIDAQKRIEFALSNVKVQMDDVDSSLHSLQQQDEALDEAIEQTAEDVPKARDTLKDLEQKVHAEQQYILTDDEATRIFNHIRHLIYEGKPGEAAQQVNLMGETAANELKAQKDFQHRAPESSPGADVQAATAHALETAVLSAEDSIDGGNKQEASEAVDSVHSTTQLDAKIKLVEITKIHVGDAIQAGDDAAGVNAINNLADVISSESGVVSSETGAVSSISGEVEKDMEADDSPESAAAEAQKLQEELQANPDVPAEINNNLSDAQHAAETGDIKAYHASLEKAHKLLVVAEDNLEKSEKAIETQQHKAEEAAAAMEAGDHQNAMRELSDIVESVQQDQPVVRVSEEAKASADAAKEAIEQGDNVQAVEHVESIISDADNSVNAAVGLEENTEIEHPNEFMKSLETLSNALQPEDPSTISDEVLESLFEQCTSHPEANDLYEALEKIRVALKARDYEQAIGFTELCIEEAQANMDAANPEDAEEDEEPEVDDGPIDLNQKKMRKATKKSEKKKAHKKTEKATEKSTLAKKTINKAVKQEAAKEEADADADDEDDGEDPIEATLKDMKAKNEVTPLAKKMRKAEKTASKTEHKVKVKDMKKVLVKKSAQKQPIKKSSFRRK